MTLPYLVVLVTIQTGTIKREKKNTIYIYMCIYAKIIEIIIYL